ncbi:hypothetical protein PAECIP111893_00482 [Paenibacillus plantiphilus]|uniref:Yip1 domain-containing protein n=1 Tax=Paenibacillus plantiphilus TaxID=2905650 RepID=A0ABN8FW63_9BACL|nr:hypothetical protein [Paenibacillus plantiphilus]CAH1193516.1 hypothetical protein PAECIP111893_00482 [Paenibacillus plantiphilus]
MSFCTKCGQRMTEGEVHHCPAVPAGAGSPAGSAGNDFASTLKQVDGNTILALLKNPQNALNLNTGKDLIYGILGIVASLIGFMIGAWLMAKKLEDTILGLFGFGGMSDFTDFDGGSSTSSMFGQMFLLGLISLAALFGTIWLIGNWRGARTLSFKDVVTYLGGLQYTFGAGFILAGLCTLVSLRFGFLLLFINLLTALVIALMTSSDLFEVSKERRLSFVGLSIALYLVVVMLLSSLIM